MGNSFKNFLSRPTCLIHLQVHRNTYNISGNAFFYFPKYRKFRVNFPNSRGPRPSPKQVRKNTELEPELVEWSPGGSLSELYLMAPPANKVGLIAKLRYHRFKGNY